MRLPNLATAFRSPALAMLGGSLLCSATSCLFSAPVKAYGFTGNFAPNNWVLKKYQTPLWAVVDSVVPPSSTLNSPAYECVSLSSVACTTLLDIADGIAVLTGSNYSASPLNPDESNGGFNEAWSIQWEITYGGSSPYATSVLWDYFSPDGTQSDQSYYYTIVSGTLTTTSLSSNPIGDAGYIPITLNTGDTIGFGIHTNDNSGGPGYLSVQFDPAPAPGPLPLLGASAAFGWSRRLRRRSRPGVAPSSITASRPDLQAYGRPQPPSACRVGSSMARRPSAEQSVPASR